MQIERRWTRTLAVAMIRIDLMVIRLAVGDGDGVGIFHPLASVLQSASLAGLVFFSLIDVPKRQAKLASAENVNCY